VRQKKLPAVSREFFVTGSQDAHPDGGFDASQFGGQRVADLAGHVQQGVGNVLFALVHHVFDVQVGSGQDTGDGRDGARGVLVDDADAAAAHPGLAHMFTNKHQYALGKIRIPNISACDGAVYVNGDSMYPILKSGDIIGYKEINSFENVIYGEIYLVSFMIDGDEYLAVKYANRSEKEGCIKLVSYNTHHEPMDIPFAAINAMAIVKFSIRRHMMM